MFKAKSRVWATVRVAMWWWSAKDGGEGSFTNWTRGQRTGQEGDPKSRRGTRLPQQTKTHTVVSDFAWISVVRSAARRNSNLEIP